MREIREAGELERKKNLRKKEERREAGERERERERERIILMREERECNKFFFF